MRLRAEAPSGHPVDVLTGFVEEDGDAMGAPLRGIDKRGACLFRRRRNVVWGYASARCQVV